MLNEHDISILLIHQRLDELENKVFKNKRPPITMGKKLLLLREMGLIDSFSNLFNTKELLYQFLSICLNGDITNIKKYLNNRNLLEIEDNYKFLIETYTKLQLNDLIKPAKEKLKKLEKKG